MAGKKEEEKKEDEKEKEKKDEENENKNRSFIFRDMREDKKPLYKSQEKL